MCFSNDYTFIWLLKFQNFKVFILKKKRPASLQSTYQKMQLVTHARSKQTTTSGIILLTLLIMSPPSFIILYPYYNFYHSSVVFSSMNSNKDNIIIF